MLRSRPSRTPPAIAAAEDIEADLALQKRGLGRIGPAPPEEARAAGEEAALERAVERVPPAPRADDGAGVHLALLLPENESDPKPRVVRPGAHDPRAEAHVGAGAARPLRQKVVQSKSGNPEGGMGELEPDGTPARKMERAPRHPLGRRALDLRPRAQAIQARQGIRRQELAADLVPREDVLLQQ